MMPLDAKPCMQLHGLLTEVHGLVTGLAAFWFVTASSCHATGRHKVCVSGWACRHVVTLDAWEVVPPGNETALQQV